MTDTFFSWFLVTELHVWMIMVRYMAEGKHGKLIRDNVIAAMWEDTDARISNLGVGNIIYSTLFLINIQSHFYVILCHMSYYFSL